MNKFDNMTFFKETKAKSQHVCSNCGIYINQGDIYYPELIKDKFLHSLHRKKLCQKCYQTFSTRK